ncbi:MAG: DUF2382 domain-containing protein [Geminicoccaceae bacterium]
MARAADKQASEPILVVEERPVVRKRRRVTGAVRVRTRVREGTEVVDRPVTIEEVEVERVPVDRWVDQPAEVREEGDVTIIPVHAEVLVVEKRLKLVEEIRVRRRRSEERRRAEVVLRSEEALVERLAAAEGEPD